MKMTLTPEARRSAITLSRRSVSVRVRLEVGSSMITSRELSESALAISTSCRWARDNPATGASGAKSTPRRAKSGAASAVSRARSTSRSGPPVSGSRPMKTLAAASRLSNRLSSWCTKAMPAAIAPGTVIAASARPSMRITPVEGLTTPPSTFISVDLPAPFSPTRPITSPGATERLTPSSATTPG